MVAPRDWRILVHKEDPERELPYRVDIARPLPIFRERPGEPLFDEDDSAVCYERWDVSTAARVSVAVSFLMRQLCSKKAARIGIVVPDELALEAAEEFLRASQLPRSRLVLLPWPIAAAWAWLERYSPAISKQLVSNDREIGSLICVQVGHRHVSAVTVRIVFCGGNGKWNVVPARNRDRDNLEIAGRADDSFAEWLSQRIGQSVGPLGLVLCGRSALLPGGLVLGAVERALASRDLPVVDESEFPRGLLTHGALVAASIVADEGIPYFESIPRIEILVSQPVLNDAPKPMYWVNESFWIDCLKGVRGAVKIGEGILVPANKSLINRPEYPLSLKSGVTTIPVAFDGRDVRQIQAVIDEKVGREREVAIQLEYRLGSGRPKITIERKRCPDEPIVFEWGAAKESTAMRSEISELTECDFHALYEERQQRRIRAGMQRLDP